MNAVWRARPARPEDVSGSIAIASCVSRSPGLSFAREPRSTSSPGMFGFGTSRHVRLLRARRARARASGSRTPASELEAHVVDVSPTASIRRRAVRLAELVAKTAGRRRGHHPSPRPLDGRARRAARRLAVRAPPHGEGEPRVGPAPAQRHDDEHAALRHAARELLRDRERPAHALCGERAHVHRPLARRAAARRRERARRRDRAPRSHARRRAPPARPHDGRAARRARAGGEPRGARRTSTRSAATRAP